MEHQSVFLLLAPVYDILRRLSVKRIFKQQALLTIQNIAAVDHHHIIKLYTLQNQVHLIQRSTRCGAYEIPLILQCLNRLKTGFLNDVVFLSLIHI